jgi:tripartite-type tricarboxylate transporter receptor subunit TctC
MTRLHRRNFLRLATAASTLPLSLQAWSQALFPQARIVIGFPAGDPADTAGRNFADRMRQSYAPTIIVDNRAGAGGRLGVQEMRNTATDGAAMLLTPASMLSLYPHIYKSLPYDPLKDLVPVSRATTFTFSLTVGPMVPETVKTLAQFFDWCRLNPTQANYASPGAGSSPHFLGATLARVSGVPINHVPYRGGSLAMNDVIGGQIAAAVTTPAAALPHVKSGRARIIAVTSPTRWSLLPEVQTMTEAGFPEVTATEWFGFFMRAGVPAATVDRVSAAIQSAATEIEASGTLATFAMEAKGSTSAELGDLLARDHAHWQEVVKRIGFTPQD